MMMQITVGCRFRRAFCDIIQFDGAFSRARTLESVRDDLGALLALGYRGGAFTVDDNFFVEYALRFESFGPGLTHRDAEALPLRSEPAVLDGFVQRTKTCPARSRRSNANTTEGRTP